MNDNKRDMLAEVDGKLSMVPEHLREGLREYIAQGRLHGHYLGAVIENDLLRAISHGDDLALAGLVQTVRFLYNYAPGSCWGSRERREEWIGHQGLIGWESL